MELIKEHWPVFVGFALLICTLILYSMTKKAPESDSDCHCCDKSKREKDACVKCINLKQEEPEQLQKKRA